MNRREPTLQGVKVSTAQPSETLYDCRIPFSETLMKLAEADARVVAVCNDSVGSSKLEGFQKRWPERLVNVGIAEQSLIGMGAGLANGGMLPFVCAAASFLTGRALEQIKVDVAYSNANVKLCGISSGMAYGELGPTHHSVEDFAWTRVIPNLVIIAPSDRLETEKAVKAAAQYDGPVFLRLSRVGVPDIVPDTYRFEIGKSLTLREGNDVTLIANGTLSHRILKAANLLAADGIQARVINMPTVKPLDETAIVNAAKETAGIVTCEEHSIYGGLGSAIAELVVTKCPAPMRILGVPGIFTPTGSAEWLLDQFKMAPSSIAAAARELL